MPEVSSVVIRDQFVAVQSRADSRHDYHSAIESALGTQRDNRASVFQPVPRPAVPAVDQLRVDGTIVIRGSRPCVIEGVQKPEDYPVVAVDKRCHSVELRVGRVVLIG